MNRFEFDRSVFVFWGIAILLLAVGCDLPSRPPLHGDRVESNAKAVKTPSNEGDNETGTPLWESPRLAFEGDWERWDALFVGERQVGYAHTTATEVGEGSRANVEYELVSNLMLNQGRVQLLQRVEQKSTETDDGRLLDFNASVTLGPATTRFIGSVSDGALTVQTSRGSSPSQQSIPWGLINRGLFAIEQSLRRQIMQSKGDVRMLKMLLPGRYEMVSVRLRCLGMASVPLLDGKLHKLIEIHSEIQLDSERTSHSTLWITESGEIARTHTPAMQLIAYRTDQATAERGMGEPLHAASIPVQGEINTPSKATRVAYVIQRSAAARAAGTELEIQPAPGQYVRRRSDDEIQVLVSRRPESNGDGFIASQLVPTDKDLSANSYIDPNHAQISRLANATIGSVARPPQEAVLELTRAVHQNVAERTKVVGLEKASTVAEYLIGDATERAIFLVALLRNQKIPARLVLGLKYSPGSTNVLAYHAWAIAFVGDEWIHLDPSEGGPAAADRLVFSTTDLSGENEYDAFQQLLNTLVSIEVEVAGQN